MKFRRFFAFALVLLFVASAPLARAENPTVVRVNDRLYDKATLDAYWDLLAQQYIDAGITPDESAIEEMRDMIVEGYVDLGVCELKCVELGLYELSEAQMAEVNQLAQNEYDQACAAYTEQIVSVYGVSREQAEESAPTMMMLSGITLEAIAHQKLSSYRNELLLQYATQGVEYTAEEIAAHYDALFVADERAKYQADFAAFEQNVIVQGAGCYYIPAGVRMIDIVVLEAPAGSREKLAAGDTAALQEIAQTYQAGLDAVRQAVSTTGDLAAAIENVSAFSLREGYLVHAESTIWDEALKAAALALQAPGDVSDVQLLNGELCVVCYRALLPEGAVTFSDEDQAALNAYTESDLRAQVLDAQVEQWKADYEIETHPELLTVPERLRSAVK